MKTLGVFIIMAVEVIASIVFIPIGFLFESLVLPGLRDGIRGAEDMHHWMDQHTKLGKE